MATVNTLIAKPGLEQEVKIYPSYLNTCIVLQNYNK